MIYEFIYLHNEIDLLLPKLHESRDGVDKFILIESPTDLLHRPKKMHYKENIDMFSDYNHKIIHIVPEDNPMKKGYDLFRERLGHVALATKDCKPNDKIIVTDPDVILKDSTYAAIDVMNLEHNEGVISVPWFCYWMNYRYLRNDHAYTNVFLYKNTVESEWASFFRWNPPLDPLVNGGWHLSKLGGVDAVIEGISGYPHLELDTDKNKNRENLQKRMDEGMGWDADYPSEVVFKAIPYRAADYPEYIVKHPEIYAKYFKGGMCEDN
jgi:beta-1,4-mannosyl-glycoprotein beta-1,4-N-acetylglucosaminyltransferase